MFKHLGIRGRVLLLTLLPTSLMALVLGGYFSWMQLQSLEQQLIQRGQLVIEHLAPLTARALSKHDIKLLNRLANETLEHADVRSVSFLSSDRKRLAHAGPRMLNPEPIGDTTLLTRHSAHDATRFLMPVFGRHGNLSDAQDNWQDELLLGWVEMELSHQGTLLNGYRGLLTSLLLIAVGLIATALLAMRMSRAINQPLQLIQKSVARLKEGHLETRLPPLGSHEMDNLASGINRMAESLQSAQEELQNSVDQATEDVRQNLETIEIQNIELDLARKEALEASRIKSEFLANMSHEIRTPLNGILGFTRLLLKNDFNSHQMEYLHTIEKSADNLLGIINEVLDFSKIEAGKLILDNVPFNLRDLLQETLTLLAPSAHQKQLELINLIYRDTPLSFAGDPQRLKQVLTNLLNNAIKFTHQGQIIIRTMLEDEIDGKTQLRISVQDTGIGLSQDELAPLFQAFSQADNSLSRQSGGTGLGLVICKHIVEQMGGEIGVSSEPNQGSNFWITLTLARAADDDKDRPLPLLDEQHAVILESSDLARQALQHQIEDCGWHTHPFAELAALLQYVKHSTGQGQTVKIALLGIAQNKYDMPSLQAAIDELEQYGCAAFVLCQSIDLDQYQTQLRNKPERLQSKPLCSRKIRKAIERLEGHPLAPVTTTPLPNRPPHILCVDDNPANLLLVSTLLKDMQAHVTAVDNGAAAVEAFQNGQFDLVLMDIQMPIMNGQQATEAIRLWEAEQQCQATPIVALTAHALANEKRALLQAGMDDYLTKPISEHQLSQVILKWTGLSIYHSAPKPAKLLPTSDRSTLPILDMHEGLQLAAGKADLAHDMLRMLLDSLPAEREAIRQARDTLNRAILLERVHRLNGATRYCGVPRLRAACQNSETLLKQNAPGADQALDVLEQAIEQLLQHASDLPSIAATC